MFHNRNESVKRKYTQFNDLVITDYQITTDYSVSFKTESNNYYYGHGSQPYVLNNDQLLQSQTLSLTLRLSTSQIRCHELPLYNEHILVQLQKAGKLWAIESNRVLWAYASVTDYSVTHNPNNDMIVMDVSFFLHEGYWHIADPMKVFLQEYRYCDFNINDDYIILDKECGEEPCQEICDALCIPENQQALCCLECSDFLDTLCSVDKSLYTNCEPRYKFEYNCEKALTLYGNTLLKGQRICKSSGCTGNIVGRFYSDTIKETKGIKLLLSGQVSNPFITLNGNSLQVMGDYDGYLTVGGNKEVIYQSDACCVPESIEIDKVITPIGSTFGLTVKHGWNELIIETGNCCEMVCAYITVDAITP